MDSPDNVSSCNSHATSDSESGHVRNSRSPNEDFMDLREQAIANLQKPNMPNINVPERIIICLDTCYDNHQSLYRFSDGTTFTPMNMMKRVLDFFFHSKHAINKKTEFALVVLKETEVCWVQNFTNNVKDIINAIDYVNIEECSSDILDFKKILQIVQQKVDIPEYNKAESILPPPYIVRMIILYGRSNCLPVIPQDDPYFNFLKKQLYFFTDILLAHEEECALYKCEEIYDALQALDNGYSYVYEVSRNATKIHDCIAKLLAHPLQRPLQKNTDYTFGSNC